MPRLSPGREDLRQGAGRTAPLDFGDLVGKDPEMSGPQPVFLTWLQAHGKDGFIFKH